MLRDSRGLTLMELMAALALTGILLAVVIMLYQSLFHVSESGMQRYVDQTEIRNVMERLEEELADAIDAVYQVDSHQLRYYNGLRARALVYDPSSKTLNMHELEDGNDLGAADLISPGSVIAGNVTDFSAVVDADRRTLDLSVTFEVSNVNVSGIREAAAETRKLSFKLMSVPA